MDNKEGIRKFIDDSILKTLSVPVILSIIGFIIINTFLSQYHLSDYNIFKPKFIATGTAFCLTTLTYILFSLMFIDTENLDTASITYVLLNVVSKCIIASLAFHAYFMHNETYSFSLFNRRISSLEILNYGMIPLVYSAYLQTQWNYLKKGSYNFFDLFTILGTIISILGASFCFYIQLIYDKYFIHTVIFFGFITLSFIIHFLYYRAGISDKKRGITVGIGLFAKDGKTNQLDQILHYSITACALLFWVVIFGNQIYPRLKSGVGGGWQDYTTICTKKEQEYSGKVVNFDDKQYYLTDSIRNIYIIQQSDIEYMFSYKQ
jgi:hypothetical protein